MIKVICKAKLKPDVNPEDYIKIASEAVSESRKEKGCIMYTLHQDMDDPTIFLTLEEWADEEALNQHNSNMDIWKYVKELRNLRESTEINHYKEV